MFIECLCSEVPVYPVTFEIARGVGRVEGQLAAKGMSIEFDDLVIGITALQLGFAVATINVRHFERIRGLKISKVSA